MVVIYTIDRLTRSLADFSKMVEVFERYCVSFVSVTQQFNTTTLAPDIVAAILDDAMPNHVTLFDLAVDPPAPWDDQRTVGLQ